MHPPDRGLPEPSFWTRLHFGWSLFWAALVTPPLTAGLLLHNLFRPTARTFKGWVGAWSRAILFFAGIRVEVEVRAELPAGRPVVFVANHQNELDIATCAAGIPYPYTFLAKAALRRVPFIGWVLARTPCVFVDRSSPRIAIQSLREAAERVRAGTSVLVYVEGARSWRRALLPFLRGAFVLAVEAGVPLVPVVVIDNYTVLDERRWCGRPGTVHLVVGEPIATAGRTRADVPELMEAARAAMEAELFPAPAEGPEAAPDVSSAAT
ncbi:MAG: lysophospholipid acyltransferase family protein [Rhodothermales bacterium]|nr:lysophospholipid acyltransferase family protein [Rhodothermales bacterium]